jgi:hypothetical protein
MAADQGSGLVSQGRRMLFWKAISGQDQGLKEVPGKVEDSVEGIFKVLTTGNEGSVWWEGCGVYGRGSAVLRVALPPLFFHEENRVFLAARRWT